MGVEQGGRKGEFGVNYVANTGRERGVVSIAPLEDKKRSFGHHCQRPGGPKISVGFLFSPPSELEWKPQALSLIKLPPANPPIAALLTR